MPGKLKVDDEAAQIILAKGDVVKGKGASGAPFFQIVWPKFRVFKAKPLSANELK